VFADVQILKDIKILEWQNLKIFTKGSLRSLLQLNSKKAKVLSTQQNKINIKIIKASANPMIMTETRSRVLYKDFYNLIIKKETRSDVISLVQIVIVVYHVIKRIVCFVYN